ncbi:hypothetical protein G9A89_013739 [Geosiphon pyriformis]|nr:hypothetical protein G9A89_013739 [Geosiphon pyriformis]
MPMKIIQYPQRTPENVSTIQKLIMKKINTLLEYFSDPNVIIQLQNEFNTIKQDTGKTVTQYFAQFNQICHQIKVIKQGYYTDPQTQKEITHTKHLKDATRNLAAAKIIACCVKTSEQKHASAIFANA